MPPPLLGPRVALRDWTLDDADDIVRYASDPEVVRYMPWGPHQTTDEVAGFLERSVQQQREEPRRFYEMAVEWRETGEVLGGGGLRVPEPEHKQGEIGYVLRRDHWGLGIGTEIAELLLDFGFGELGLHRVAAGTDAENVASQRVLEKAGMRREAHFRQDKFRRGEWCDSFIFAILEDEWRTRRHHLSS